MSYVKTTYNFNGKSDFLKFVDKRNENFYKILNGKTYTLLSTDEGKRIKEKTFQLNRCKKVVALIKCVACSPLLAVTIMLKITSKENKLAAARFNRIQLAAKKSVSSSGVHSRTATVTNSSDTKLITAIIGKEFSIKDENASKSQRKQSSKKQDFAIELDNSKLPIEKSISSARKKEASKSSGREDVAEHLSDSELSSERSMSRARKKEASKSNSREDEAEHLSDSELSNKGSSSRETTSSGSKRRGCKIKLSASDLKKAQAVNTTQNDSWFQFPSRLQTLTRTLSKQSSSAYKTATTKFTSMEASVNHSQNEDEVQANKFTAFLTNTVAPAAIKGTYYLTEWAIKQIVKDGLVYGTAALTGLPPEELRYGINLQAEAAKY